MAEIIVMPKLGFNQEEGELVKWHKQVGNPINKGDLLFETNTDKTTMPVEATRDGILLKILVAEGEAVPVFTPIAVVGDAGEDADAALSAAAIGQDAPGQEPNAHTNEEPASEGSLGLEGSKADAGQEDRTSLSSPCHRNGISGGHHRTRYPSFRSIGKCR